MPSNTSDDCARSRSPTRAASTSSRSHWSADRGTISGTSCTGNGNTRRLQGHDFGDPGAVVRRLQRLRPAGRLGPDRLQPDQRGGPRRHHRQRHEQLRRRLDAQPRVHAQALRPQHRRRQRPADRPPLRELDEPPDRARRLRAGQRQRATDADVVYYGCGPGNPLGPRMNPLFVYSRPPGSDCSPATDGNTTDWPNGNHQDCVQTTPGQRRRKIICPLVDRIVGSAVRAELHQRSAARNMPGQQLVEARLGQRTSRRVTRGRSR